MAIMIIIHTDDDIFFPKKYAGISGTLNKLHIANPNSNTYKSASKLNVFFFFAEKKQQQSMQINNVCDRFPPPVALHEFAYQPKHFHRFNI